VLRPDIQAGVADVYLSSLVRGATRAESGRHLLDGSSDPMGSGSRVTEPVVRSKMVISQGRYTYPGNRTFERNSGFVIPGGSGHRTRNSGTERGDKPRCVRIRRSYGAC
jgi:hypothetical protein